MRDSVSLGYGLVDMRAVSTEHALVGEQLRQKQAKGLKD